MFLAVIRNRLGITVNPYNYFVLHRRDRQSAELSFHSELCRHIVLGIILHHCRTGYRCGVLTSIGALGFSSQARNSVLLTIDSELIGHKACDLLFPAIVGLRAAVGGDSDLVLFIFSTILHSQSAFGLGDLVVVSLCALIQRVAEFVCTAANQSLAAGEFVGCAFAFYPTSFCFKSSFAVRQSGAIVLLVQIGRLQGDSALSDRQSAELSFHSELCRHIVLGIILHHCRTGYRCGVLTSIGALGFSSQARNSVLLTIDSELIGHKACDLLFPAIVGLRAAVGGDSDLVLFIFSTILHSQSAFGLGDLVVVSLCALIQRVAEFVCTAANQSLAAGEFVGCAFAFYPTSFCFKSSFAVRQSGAIVLLVQIGRLQGDSALSDRQLAVLSFHIELCCHIVASSILHHCNAGYRCGVLTSIGALGFSTQTRNGVLLTIDSELIGHKACDLLFLAIVGLRAALGGDSDLVLFSTVGHSQSAFGLGDGVVVSIRAIVQRIAECVCTAANHSLAAGEGVGCAFAICPTSFCFKGGFTVDQSSTIVFLAQISRLQGDSALSDRQLAVIGSRYNVLFGRINGANCFSGTVGSIREVSRICASVGAGGVNGDCTEVCAFRSAGEAGNTLWCAIVGFRSAVGGERNILVVEECNHILRYVFINDDRLGFSAHRRVAFNGYRLQIFNLFADIRRSCSRIMYWRGSAIPVVIHRVGSGGWDPLCLKGNIVIRHGKLAVFDGYAGFPAIKFVAFSGRICLYGVGVAFVHIVHEGVVTRPAATIQIISHLMFFHISAVEGDIVRSQLVRAIECDQLAEIFIPIPAAESILFALFVQFGRRNTRHSCYRHLRVDIVNFVILCLNQFVINIL